jgi:hypothetical protein
VIAAGNPLRKPLLATLAFFVLALCWIGAGRWHAARVLAPVEPLGARAHVIVSLDFPPEGFHTTRLQAIGRVVEVRGRDVLMMDVDAAALRTFAAQYWVDKVASWPGR